MAIAFAFRKGDADAAFARRARVVEERFRSHRHIAAADRDARRRGRRRPARRRSHRVGVEPDAAPAARLPRRRARPPARTRLRVVAPDVGGAFGMKGSIYPEDLLGADGGPRAGPAGEVDRGPRRAPRRRHPWPRAGPPDRARRRRRRAHPRRARRHRAQRAARSPPSASSCPTTASRTCSARTTSRRVDFRHASGADQHGGHRALSAAPAGRRRCSRSSGRLDRLARALGMDPAELRERNMVRPGADAVRHRARLPRRRRPGLRLGRLPRPAAQSARAR